MAAPEYNRAAELHKVIDTLDAMDLALAVAMAGERLLRLQAAQAESDPLAIAPAVRERDADHLNH